MMCRGITTSNGNFKRETGTVEFHSLNPVGFWKQCEDCLTAS